MSKFEGNSKMNSLTEEEILEKYEKIRHNPSAGQTHNGNTSNGNGAVKMLDQSRTLLGFPDTEGLRMRKIDGGSLEHYDSDGDSEGDSDDKTVDVKYGDKEDFQRPSKLDLIVGFLRFSNFLSCATAVFGVTFSILYSLNGPSSDLVISANLTTVYNIWSPITLSSSNQYSRWDFEFHSKILEYFVYMIYVAINSIE